MADGWFSHTVEGLSLISTHDWQKVRPPPVAVFLLHELTLAAFIQGCNVTEAELQPHEDTCGCFFDLCDNRSDVRLKLKAGFICSLHQSLFKDNGGTPARLDAVLDLVEQTRLAAIPARTQKRRNPAQVDAAVLCALPAPEMSEAIRALSPDAAPVQHPTVPEYQVVSVPCAGGGRSLRVAIRAAVGMGIAPMAVLASETIHLLQPNLVLSCGIAAGSNRSRQNFGDILVAELAFNYRYGKIGEDGSFLPDPRQVHITTTVANHVHQLNGRGVVDNIQSAWRRHPAYKRPPADLATHFGPLASADQVVNDSTVMPEILRHMRSVIGLEMETFGLYAAAQYTHPSHRVHFLSCKSVCDFAEHKEDGWQVYAAFTSAQYIARFLVTFGAEYRWTLGWVPSQLP
jgi:nucleoside phosphorylase